MFNNLLVADDGRDATPLKIVTPEGLGALGAEAQAWAARLGFEAKPGQWLAVPDAAGGLAAVLAGVSPEPGPWRLASVAAEAPAGDYRLEGHTTDDPDLIGWLLAHYRFNRYRKEVEVVPARRLLVPDATPVATLVAQAEAIALVRDLVTTPASDLGPEQLGQAARALAARFGAAVTEIVGADLLTQGYPAVHAVGRAAARPPRLIRLDWSGSADGDKPVLALVGKGVVFDSGGLNIKTTAGMATMKKDMGGAAHALALAHLVMAHDLPVTLRVIIPAVENAISGDAMRPGDVLHTRAGLTVEVTNTDAEGRLILADALTAAAEFEPDLLIDFATLTGAARVALGPDLPAMFTPDDALAEALLAAATRTADPLWRMPLWLGYREMMKSSVADMVNAADSSYAGAITAALFLQQFVKSIQNWVHIDVYAWSGAAKPGRIKGGEAMTLRAFWHLLADRYGTK